MEIQLIVPEACTLSTKFDMGNDDIANHKNIGTKY
jgi:hypothetical protein